MFAVARLLTKDQTEQKVADGNRVTGDRCYDFKYMFAETNCEKIGVFWPKTKLNYAKFWSLHWFLRKTPLFGRKLAKIAENNIITSTLDWVIFLLLGDYFLWAGFKITL
jgi:hypothetical protein